MVTITCYQKRNILVLIHVSVCSSKLCCPDSDVYWIKYRRKLQHTSGNFKGTRASQTFHLQVCPWTVFPTMLFFQNFQNFVKKSLVPLWQWSAKIICIKLNADTNQNYRVFSLTWSVTLVVHQNKGNLLHDYRA